jgi:hypothetical protein
MRNILTVFVAIAAFASANAREISFPSVSGFSSDQAILGIITPDITQAKFAGLMTYANLPYAHCLAPEGDDVERFDIAILGAPFDTVSRSQYLHCAQSISERRERVHGLFETAKPNSLYPNTSAQAAQGAI